MFYLFACNRDLFKSYYFYGLFLPSEKPFKYHENCFQFLLYILLPTSTRQKCVFMKNVKTFPSKFFHFQYDNRFLFSRKMENIRNCKEVRLQKISKFRLSEDSINFDILQVASKRRIFWGEFLLFIFWKTYC